MSGRLLALSGRDVIRAFNKAGFRLRRINGSHRILEHPGPPVIQIVVPVHGGRTIPTGTLRAILKKSQMSEDDFLRVLR